MNEQQILAYLDRIGVGAPRRPELETLAGLQEQHLTRIPFENIDFHLHKPVGIGTKVLPKIIDDHRGGACVELNSCFEQLLHGVGFTETRILGGRMYERDVLLPPLCHFVVLVELPEPYLVDVGFIRGSRYPLRFDLRTPQADPEGEFLLSENPDGTIDLVRNGIRQYRLEPRRLKFSRFPDDWYARSAPELRTSQTLLSSILTIDGRTTMIDQRILMSTVGSESKRVELGSEDEVLSAYESIFGLKFDKLPVPLAAD
ncbi:MULTISPECIES: arylamine N-acetyltransferase [unclassified Nocardia]|uniref:arylamine N-acetyltransferase family protein n=1 Tax=unclassified Nocardia TaxID=2637762 RepID=UPI001CE4968F|nr:MULTISPECIES: arylamine N-acetyltransferase [unclassified Nocardia]